MDNRISIYKNILAELTNHMLLLAVCYVILKVYIGEEPQLFLLLIPMGVCVYQYFVREYCKQLPLLFILHAVPLVLFFVLYHGYLGHGIFITAMLILYAILSVHRRITNMWRGMEILSPFVMVGGCFLLYIMDVIQGGGVCFSFLLKVLIIYFGGYFLYTFLQKFLFYMDINKRTTENIPIQSIFFSSLFLVMGFIVVVLALIVITADRELMDRVGIMLRDGFITVIGAILTFFFRDKEVEFHGVFAAPGKNIGLPVTDKTEPSIIVKIVDFLLTAGTIILIVVAVFLGIVGLIKFIRYAFHVKKLDNILPEDSYRDVIETIHPKDRAKSSQKDIFERMKDAFSPEEKIRHIYKKTLLKAHKEDYDPSCTARESCTELFGESDLIRDFIHIYEKARYGNHICTAEDVRRVKALSRDICNCI